MIKAHQRARRADTEKDVPAGSAARLSTAQADRVLKAKTMAAESAAATGQAESAAATGQAAAAASAAASAGEAGSDNRRRRRREAMKKAAARNKAAASAAVPREQPLSLLVDTGVMTTVAGLGWEALRGNVYTEGFNVRGVGGDVARITESAMAGVAMNRVTRESRYLATRLAMLRPAVADGVIILRKIDTKTNPADIFTKPLVGETLRRLRALSLGHHVEALGA